MELSITRIGERKEDIEPNIDFELARYAKEYGIMPRFNQQSLNAYLKFATSPQVKWQSNFRELNSSITRMATPTSQYYFTTGRTRNISFKTNLDSNIKIYDDLISTEIDKFDSF